MKTLGSKIQENRKRMNLTQEELAEKVNVSSQAVSKWENDLSIPDLPVLIELSELFNCTLDELIKPQEKMDAVVFVEEGLRKPVEQLMLKVKVNTTTGDKVKVNLPMSLVKMGLEIGMDNISLGGNDSLKNIDFDNIIHLVENGAMGKLVEVETAEGDIVEVVVE